MMDPRIDIRVDKDRAAAQSIARCLTRLAERLRAEGYLYESLTVADAACLLDAYQSGRSLVTPSPLTGYRLVEEDRR